MAEVKVAIGDFLEVWRVASNPSVMAIGVGSGSHFVLTRQTRLNLLKWLLTEFKDENSDNDKRKGGKADDVKVNTQGTTYGNVVSSAQGGAQQARAPDDRGAALRDQLQREISVDLGRGESDPWERFTLPNTGR